MFLQALGFNQFPFVSLAQQQDAQRI
jgi:hypothetical protein